MKKIYLLLILLIPFTLISLNAFPQCEPMTPEECPDPENNGQVCPDSLEMAFLSQFYSQVATIKPPAVYYVPPDSTQVNLHHVKLMGVGGLPEGLAWQSNTPDSIFNAGEYYCVIMEGYPQAAGDYPLKITVDVYVLVFNTPVKVATVVDSTSLSIQVVDDSGAEEENNLLVQELQNIPNPFKSETRLTFYSGSKQSVTFTVYSPDGRVCHKREILTERGENTVLFNGETLLPGMYFYSLNSSEWQRTGKMIRTDH